jgi:hypothetical protein
MSIKSQATDKAAEDNTKEFSLEDAEFNYVMNVNQAKQNIVGEYNRVMSAFLHYVASSRVGYS